MKKRRFILFLFIILPGRFIFSEMIIDDSFTENQKSIIETDIQIIQKLSASTLKISRSVYRKKSQFKKLFGFSFNGNKLYSWVNQRVHHIYYQNTWTTAVHSGTNSIYLGDDYFKSDQIERLYILIHEARHSDDPQKRHVSCAHNFPFVSASQPLIDLEEAEGCDNIANGPYAFQAAFLFELYAYALINQVMAGHYYNASVSRVQASD